jgi:hypothetical protein
VASGSLVQLDRRGHLRRRWWSVLGAVLVGVAAGCGSGPATGLAPTPVEYVGVPVRMATAAELRAAITAHVDEARTARVEFRTTGDGIPPAVGVVQWRPTYASDVVAHWAASATAPAADIRHVEIGDDDYSSASEGLPGKPWKKQKPPGGQNFFFVPPEGVEFDAVVAGEPVRGQQVLGYKFDRGAFVETFFMNGQNQLVQVVTEIPKLSTNTVTYYDFGIETDIVAPPPDQVEPA